MSRTRENTVQFLCTGNYYRSRFAEVFFNAVAAKEGLCWRADSRGLAVGRSGKNVGPLSAFVIQLLEELDIRLSQPPRFPVQVNEDDLHRADLIVAVKEAEHRPLLVEQFPSWADRVEYWHVHDLDFATHEEALPHIRQEVLSLVRCKAMMLPGSGTRESGEMVQLHPSALVAEPTSLRNKALWYLPAALLLEARKG